MVDGAGMGTMYVGAGRGTVDVGAGTDRTCQ